MKILILLSLLVVVAFGVFIVNKKTDSSPDMGRRNCLVIITRYIGDLSHYKNINGHYPSSLSELGPLRKCPMTGSNYSYLYASNADSFCIFETVEHHGGCSFVSLSSTQFIGTIKLSELGIRTNEFWK